MKLKQLLEQLNQLAKERPEALEMEVEIDQTLSHEGSSPMSEVEIEYDSWRERSRQHFLLLTNNNN
jgi:hypothetical protein